MTTGFTVCDILLIIRCFRLTLSLLETDKVLQIATFHQSLHSLPNSENQDGRFYPSLTYMIYAHNLAFHPLLTLRVQIMDSASHTSKINYLANQKIIIQ